MYAKLLSGRKELEPAAEGTCHPCGGIPVNPQMESEPVCVPAGYVDGYC